jgi:murein DD-endopeptidase MepM/ murein hydrolase activator NlpD
LLVAAAALAAAVPGLPVPASAQTETRAEAPSLELPLRCVPGETCWIVNYVDLDSGPGTLDYGCGRHTYDSHKGTDFAIRDARAMKDGVAVVAAAAGEVAGARDGEPDVDVNERGRDGVKGRECGNGVLLRHGGGWETQYCHLRKGTVAVAVGEKVAAGHKLGLVGNSGLAEFPHVHLEVRRAGKTVDPFVGLERKDGCALGESHLWKRDVVDKLRYRPTALYNAGVAATVPKAASARAGAYADSVLSRSAPVLILWADMFWVEAGDALTLRITGPDGETVVEHANAIDKTQARRFAYAGAKRTKLFWDEGAYRGEITLVREKGGKSREVYSAAREFQVR